MTTGPSRSPASTLPAYVTKKWLLKQREILRGTWYDEDEQKSLQSTDHIITLALEGLSARSETKRNELEGARLSLEGDTLCIRTSAGWLLWRALLEDVPAGIDLETILEEVKKNKERFEREGR